MSDERKQPERILPRWFVCFFWSTHRGLYRVTGGRVGLRRAKANRWGIMGLTTTGPSTGQQRSVIIGYFKDGPNLVTMAMNGWADDEPAWWLNLQAHPEASVELVEADARSGDGLQRERNGRDSGPGVERFEEHQPGEGDERPVEEYLPRACCVDSCP